MNFGNQKGEQKNFTDPIEKRFKKSKYLIYIRKM